MLATEVEEEAGRGGCVRGISEEASLPILGLFDAHRMAGESTTSPEPKILQVPRAGAA